MTQLSYDRYHAKALPGLAADFHTGSHDSNYTNPFVFQIQELTISTIADGDWVITMTDSVTLAAESLTVNVSGTASAEKILIALRDGWNADPALRVLGVAKTLPVTGTVTSLQVEANKAGRTYTFAVTEPGIGAAAWANITPAGGYDQEIGAWVIRATTTGAGNPVDDDVAIETREIPDAFSDLKDVVGVARRALHFEQKENELRDYDHYQTGQDFPARRRGGIWVPVVVTCRPGDDVEIHNTSTGFRNGWTTTGGAGLVVPWAEFLTVAINPGDLVVIGLTKA